MNDYIRQWLEIIENMNNDNTYKLAWVVQSLNYAKKRIN